MTTKEDKELENEARWKYSPIEEEEDYFRECDQTDED